MYLNQNSLKFFNKQILFFKLKKFLRVIFINKNKCLLLFTQLGLFVESLCPRPSWPHSLLPNEKTRPYSVKQQINSHY